MKKRHHTKEQMLSFYAEWRESKLCKTAFCEEVGLATSTFTYWIRKLKLRDQDSSEAPAIPGFAQLDFPSKPDQVLPVVEIEYPSGARIKFYKQPEANWIKKIL